MGAVMDMDVLDFLNSDVPVSAWTGTDAATATLSGMALVMHYRNLIGRKFEVEDIDSNGQLGTDLYEAAAAWLPTQTEADFGWLRSLARKYAKGGGLSNGAAKGVLNCMVAASRRSAAVPQNPVVRLAEAQKAVADATVTDADDDAADAYAAHVAAKVSRGYYTIVRDDDSHITMKVGRWYDDNYRPGRKVRWIGYLRGPVNVADYQTFARQGEDGVIHLTSRYRDNAELLALANMVLHGTSVDRDGYRHAYAIESGNCAICNRVLTVPDSIRRGVGPDCATKAF